MFGIGLPELILIMAVALIVVGPEKLPGLAKSLAKGILELKKAASTLQESLHEDDSVPLKDSSADNNPDQPSAPTSLPQPAEQKDRAEAALEPTSMVEDAAAATDIPVKSPRGGGEDGSP